MMNADLLSNPDVKKRICEALAEDLLLAFAEAPLIDKYDVYQHLMSYWTDTVQDDVYMIVADGWQVGNDVSVIDSKKEKTEFVIGRQKFKGSLIPAQLLVNRYFAVEQQAIEKLAAEKEAVACQMEEMAEERGGEGGLLEEAKNDKGKITKANVKARLNGIWADPDADDERMVLNEYLALIEQESGASRRIKEAQKALDAKVAARYKALSEDEVKTLVVDDKWLATLSADVQTELDRISQTLTGRIKQLAERYAMPLPQLTEEVEALSGKVDAHLKGMGFV